MDENLWIEQRRFVLKQLREFGFGRKSMAVIIEEETRWLIEHFKKLISIELDNKIKAESAKSSVRCNNNEKGDGKIYELIKTNTPEKSSNKPHAKREKLLKASDMYIDANEYSEVRRMARSNPGIVIQMNDAFGVTVLNTLWRMMAGKRLSILYIFHEFNSFRFSARPYSIY